MIKMITIVQLVAFQKPKKSTETIEVEDEEWALSLSEESDAEDSVKRDPDWVKSPWPQRRSGRRTRSNEASLRPEQVLVRKKLVMFNATCLFSCCSFFCALLHPPIPSHTHTLLRLI